MAEALGDRAGVVMACFSLGRVSGSAPRRTAPGAKLLAAGQHLGMPWGAAGAMDGPASVNLAHLAFDAGQEDIALDHLKDYLSWHVARGRNFCDGCAQKRGEDAPMLTCSGCLVARFCSVDHQKMASKSVPLGLCVRSEQHKEICGLLGKWRGVDKDGVSPYSLRADLQTPVVHCRARRASCEGPPHRNELACLQVPPQGPGAFPASHFCLLAPGRRRQCCCIFRLDVR